MFCESQGRKASTYPLIPVHVPKTHSDMVGSMAERTVWIRFGLMYVPVGKGSSSWPFEIDRLPYFLKLSAIINHMRRM